MAVNPQKAVAESRKVGELDAFAPGSPSPVAEPLEAAHVKPGT